MPDHEAPEDTPVRDFVNSLLHRDDNHPDNHPKLTDEEWSYVLTIHDSGE